VRYAVIGSAGQLGRDLCPRLAGEVVPLTRERADLTRADLLSETLADVRPDVVVNCAAYNFVDRAETEPETAFAVNALGVRQLALVCRARGCVLVHFSSDYVFGLDDTRRVPYAETDAPGPVNVYGSSKLAGEYFVRALCPRHFVIRTCGLYGLWGSGGKGGNFVETMLRLAGQGKRLPVVNDQTCTPSYTVDVADAAAALIGKQRYGLYHLTNAGATSWHDFARTIFELSGVSADLTAIGSAEYARPAQRPAYSVLSAAGCAQLGLRPLRPWRAALEAYMEERKRK
jgi:dTDP-4-dehydrorhamnose reductase